MSEFIPYIRQRLEASGYTCKRPASPNDLYVSTPEKQEVWIAYLSYEVTPEQIRRCFDVPGYVLFVVDEKLMPAEIVDRDSTPMWLRVLHGLYMGRVYTWNGRHLYGLHFDYDTGDVSESAAIQPDELLLVETGTWLRGWPGTYRLARFFDKQWWNEQTAWDNEYARQQSSSRQSYEQARDSYQEQARKRQDKFNEDFGLPPIKRRPATDNKRDFMREFMACADAAAAKSLYKKLAKEFHPDLNPGKDTTVEMQQLNLAWEKAERMFT